MYYALSETPVVRSSYFQQMMQDAAQSMHASSGNVMSADRSSNAVDNAATTTDHTTCEDHSNTCDADVASSIECPVDSSKTSQQLIG